MRYLWNHDIQMDVRALTKLLGGAPEHTPLAQAGLLPQLFNHHANSSALSELICGKCSVRFSQLS